MSNMQVHPMFRSILNNFFDDRPLSQQLLSPIKYQKTEVYESGTGDEDDPLISVETRYEPVTKRWKSWTTESGEFHRIALED